MFTHCCTGNFEILIKIMYLKDKTKNNKMDNINQKELYINIYEEYIIKNKKVHEIIEKINKTNNINNKKEYYRIFNNLKKRIDTEEYYEKVYRLMIDSIEKSEDKIISFIIPEVKRVLRENFDEIYIHKNYIFRLVDLLNDYIKNKKLENIYNLAKSRIMMRDMLFKKVGNYYKEWENDENYEYIKKLYKEFYCGEYIKQDTENIEVLLEYDNYRQSENSEVLFAYDRWYNDYNECKYDTMYIIFYMYRNGMYDWNNTYEDGIQRVLEESEYTMDDFNFERVSDEDSRLENIYKDSENYFIYEEYQKYIKELNIERIYDKEDIDEIII